MSESVQERLDDFRVEIQFNLALGAHADRDLSVVADDGTSPVIAVLDDERLSVLLRRVQAVGGYANVFAKGRSVRYIAVVDAAGALDPSDGEDMVSTENRPQASTTVGMFLDYLETQPNGVRLPTALGSGSEPSLAQAPVTVEFEKSPVT